MHVLVTGGTGTLGRHLVDELIGAGHRVRVLSRSLGPKLPAGVEAAHGNVLEPASLAAAVAGVDVVVHAATGRRRIRDTEVVGTGNVVDAATRAGVDHLVYTSIVGCDRNPFFYYQAKVAAEAAVGTAAVPSTIVRITQFHQLIDELLSLVGRLPGLLPVAQGWRFQPIDAANAARHVARAAVGEPGGRAADVAGPEVRGLDELARAWAAATGKRRRVVSVPLPGATAKAFGTGSALSPDRAVGTITWEQYLAAR